MDGEDTYLGELKPRDGKTVWQQIEESGAPQLLLERYEGRLEPHAPWHRDRQFSHLLRGLVDVDEANALLPDNLRLVDNGDISPKETLLGLEGPPHAYHLIPRGASKAEAVAAHMRARGYAREECMAVGRLRRGHGRGRARGPLLPGREREGAARRATTSRSPRRANGEGFYEAVVRTLAESR